MHVYIAERVVIDQSHDTHDQKRPNQNGANCLLIQITDENVLIVLLTSQVQQFCVQWLALV